MTERAYFAISSFDYAPDELVKIGQIIRDLTFPGDSIQQPLQPLPKIYSSVKCDWQTEYSRTMSGSIGIWAQSVAFLLGFGSDVTAVFTKEESSILKFQKLETQFIKPTKEYIQDAMATDDMVDYLKRNPKTGALYMITGIKIARGPEYSKKKARKLRGDGTVGVDGTATGIPVSLGPRAGVSITSSTNESFARSSDFVFAYRLRRIRIRQKGAKIQSEEYDIKGKMYSENTFHTNEDVGQLLKGQPKDDLDLVFETGAEDTDFGSDIKALPSGFRSVLVRDECEIDDEDEDENRDCRCVFEAKPKV